MRPLDLPALHASHAGQWLADLDGRLRPVDKGEAIMAAADTPLLLLNAPLIGSRLGYPELSGLDLLELFAFVHPARFMVPTPAGLAEAVGLVPPAEEAQVPHLLRAAAAELLARCTRDDWAEREGAWSQLQSLARLRWPWAGLLAPHLARPERAERWLFARLPEWDERPPRPQPAQVTLDGDAIEQRLAMLTGVDAERRPGQRRYARAAAEAFAPRPSQGKPNMVLAQAGTGIGKTLGYLAPASLWAKAADGTVWVSTFTRALQRQLRQESRRAWPAAPAGDAVAGAAAEEARPRSPRVVVRKGRENYLCLLNLEDALQGGFAGRAAVFAQLVARWAGYSEDGDMVGGDLPGWLATLFRRRAIAALTDRRGECVYAGCPHYRKCFIERAARDGAQADLVIANHALVMVHAARSGAGGGRDPGQRPTRIVFDEGHHLFDAADATFAAALSGSETIEMRRWVVGPESRARGRRRGLAARLADIASYDEDAAAAIAEARAAAELLPSDGWLGRIVEGAALGPLETLLAMVRALTYARDESGGQEQGYGLETELVDLDGPFVEGAGAAADALARLRRPLMRLALRIDALIEEAPDWMDAAARARAEGARHAIGWRAETLGAWAALLTRTGGPPDPRFVDWLAVERVEGREIDIAVHRRWLDPMEPFAEVVLAPAHGIMQTSATLCDRREAHPRESSAGRPSESPNRICDDPGPDTLDWNWAVARSGAPHLDIVPQLAAADSPFDYAAQAEVLIVTDVKKGDLAALAAAYGRLIEAAGGGALGLFTAIRRLHAVHARIADRLARSSLPLFAQHVDPIDTGTLVDIFRADPRASLLGTDALRDGVDVPGHSLRLVIMEQVPWPKPSILHRARRAAAPDGAGRYDDAIIRARLAQAFGRLIRAKHDRGHFVVLSAAFPSRLLSAFPAGTPIRRVTLDDALQTVARSVLMQAHG